MKKLVEKVFFVTGGNSGLGKACALQAAHEGAYVVIADLAKADHSATLKEVQAISPKSIFVPIDVSDEESVKAAVAKVVETFGRLDIAVNNAGINGPYAPIHEMESSEWRRIIDINLTGSFLCAKYELTQFVKQGGGVIVTLASLAAFIAEIDLAPYTASKHGVVGLTKNIAAEYGDKNIRANAVCPYYIATDMTASAPAEQQKAWAEATSMKRIGKSEEVAKAVIFFASDDSSYCNGTVLPLDGGKIIF